MRRSPVLALLVVLLLGTPTAASADTGTAALTAVRTAGTAVVPDPATGRMTITVDDTVGPGRLAELRGVAERAGAVLRREPGRLRTLVAGGQAVYSGAHRCTLGANVHRGATWYFITAGHCVTGGATTWYADAGQATVLGSRVGVSFPADDYGLVRYTNALVPHPSAVYTYPGLLDLKGFGTATVGMAVCRSGVTTGVRCGRVTALNATVNYAEGSVTGLIRTTICAEPGDSGGPLYVAATGILLGILSGGSGNCTTGGVSYYQPIGEILSAYGVTLP
jgi:streptogrisin B